MLQLYTVLHVIEARLRRECMQGGPTSCNVYHLL